MSLRIVTVTIDLQTFANAASDLDELLSFPRALFLNRLLAPLTGQPKLKVGGLQGSDSVFTLHPPRNPLWDPIPLKAQLPFSRNIKTRNDAHIDAGAGNGLIAVFALGFTYLLAWLLHERKNFLRI